MDQDELKKRLTVVKKKWFQKLKQEGVTVKAEREGATTAGKQQRVKNKMVWGNSDEGKEQQLHFSLWRAPEKLSQLVPKLSTQIAKPEEGTKWARDRAAPGDNLTCARYLLTRNDGKSLYARIKLFPLNGEDLYALEQGVYEGESPIPPLVKENLKGFEKSEKLMEQAEDAKKPGETFAGKMLVDGLYAGPVPSFPSLGVGGSKPPGGDQADVVAKNKGKGKEGAPAPAPAPAPCPCSCSCLLLLLC